MTADEIAEGLKTYLDEAHAYVDELPRSPYRVRATLILGMIHRGMKLMEDHARDGGHLQTFSSGDKDPEGGG